MPLDNDYDIANDAFAQSGGGYHTPRPERPRAHLADIVAALWASGYRPFSNTTGTEPLYLARGGKALYRWHNVRTGLTWTLYTVNASSAAESVITADLRDPHTPVPLFSVGHMSESGTHHAVLAQIGNRRS